MNSAPSAPSRILLVDDNRDGLLVRKALLEELGYQVQVAENGEEGLKTFAAGRFDVVVTDLKMPRMNGTELISRIRGLDANVRFVLLSGFVEPLGLTEESTGADAVIAKSSNEPARLVRSIRRLTSPDRKPPASQRGGSRLRLTKTR